MVRIKQINTLDPLYQEERTLRNIVLLRPIGVPDHAWEMNDTSSWHFVAIENNELYHFWFKLTLKILNRILQNQGKKRRNSLSYCEYF